MAGRKLKTEYGIEAQWTPIQVGFVAEYFRQGMVASRAAEAAGSQSSNLKVIGAQLLNTPHVAKAIAERRRKNLKDIEEDLQWKLRNEWMAQAFTDRTEMFQHDWTPKSREELTPEQKALVDGVTYQTNSDGDTIVTLKLISKASAQVNLAKAVGLMNERVEHGFPELEQNAKTARAKIDGLREALLKKLGRQRADQQKEESETPSDGDTGGVS